MISVIVPVYNVEQYLDKCIQSLMEQTYTDFEILLVDDGSTDSCPAICDEYAKKDSRIRSLHKQNGGLSDARNYGVNFAKGEYVTFIDSDDYVDSSYLETLDSLLKKYNSDIAVTGITTFTEDNIPSVASDAKEHVYTGLQAFEKMLYQDTLDTSACAMLIPLKMAKGIPFPVGKYHEDEFTTYKYYVASTKVAVTTAKQYFYLQRAGSIMHSFGKSSMDELEAADNLVDYCKNNYPDIVAAAESKKFSDYCQVLLSNEKIKIENPEVYHRITQYLNAKKIQMLLDKKARLKNRVAAGCLMFGDAFLYHIFKLKKRN